jgi:UDP-N-acetylmuramyl tripeptide synthase
MTTAATVVVNDSGGERGRGKRKEGREVKMKLTARSHVQLGLTEIFDGKRDGVAWF